MISTETTMDTAMDEALAGRKSKSERAREKVRAARAKMSNAAKLAEWEKKMGDRIGTFHIPKDIDQLPCQCEHSPSVGFRLTRQAPSQSWRHERCGSKKSQ